MTDRHARWGAATGILFVAMVIVGFLVQPKPPAADAPASEILEYVVNHDNTLHIVQVIFGIAGFFYFWFIGSLRSGLARAEGLEARLANTAFGGGLVAGSTLLVGGGLAAVAALHASENSPELTRALIDGSLLIPAVGAPAAAVFFAANGLSILRYGFLPAWLGWLAMVTALVNLFPLGNVFTDHGVFADDGVLGFFAGFILFLAWFLCASIALMGRVGERGETPATPE